MYTQPLRLARLHLALAAAAVVVVAFAQYTQALPGMPYAQALLLSALLACIDYAYELRSSLTRYALRLRIMHYSHA